VARATICKAFRFEAAHQLPHHDGKCAHLHGHSYVVEVFAAGEVKGATGEPDEGMVMDFARIKELWQPIHTALDHHHLNEVLLDLNDVTTAENLAGWMLNLLHRQEPRVTAVRVYETATSWVEVCA
jgi:6-pyruvoyltetrahydropterin/6-carboxytetrahydropterin synthase